MFKPPHVRWLRSNDSRSVMVTVVDLLIRTPSDTDVFVVADM